MPKKTIETEWRVIIEPRSLGNFGIASMSDAVVCPDEAERLREYQQKCENIATEVKRHVDDVGSVFVDAITEDVCEFCGGPWTEDDSTFNGGCCDKDMENEPVEEATRSHS